MHYVMPYECSDDLMLVYQDTMDCAPKQQALFIFLYID